MRRARAIATSIGVLTTLALVAMWWRSCSTADRIEGWLWDGDATILVSKQGCVGAIKFRWPGMADEWGWDVQSHPTDSFVSIPPRDMNNYTNPGGFGRLNHLNYILSSPVELNTGVVIGGQGYFLRGVGCVVPYWFLILLSTIATTLTRWRGRVTVRGMLIVTALVAVLLVVFKLWVFGDVASDAPVLP